MTRTGLVVRVSAPSQREGGGELQQQPPLEGEQVGNGLEVGRALQRAAVADYGRPDYARFLPGALPIGQAHTFALVAAHVAPRPVTRAISIAQGPGGYNRK